MRCWFASRLRERAAGDLAGALEVHEERLTSSIRTSTSGDGETGLALDLVGDPGADGRRDLGEVQAVLDDDVEVDLEAAVAGLDLDAVGEPIAARETREAPARHADDAVALGGDVTDDLRDRLGRDGDPPEVGRPREMDALVHAARLDDARAPEGYVESRIEPGDARAEAASRGAPRP